MSNLLKEAAEAPQLPWQARTLPSLEVAYSIRRNLTMLFEVLLRLESDIYKF